MQRLLPLAAGGRIHAAKQQGAVEPAKCDGLNGGCESLGLKGSFAEQTARLGEEVEAATTSEGHARLAAAFFAGAAFLAGAAFVAAISLDGAAFFAGVAAFFAGAAAFLAGTGERPPGD